MYFAFIIQLSPKKSTLALQEDSIKNCCRHDRKNVLKKSTFFKKRLDFLCKRLHNIKCKKYILGGNRYEIMAKSYRQWGKLDTC